MAGKKNFGENGKKVSGNAQKAEAAAAKAAAANQAQAKAEEEDWGRGAKNSSKKYASPLTPNTLVRPLTAPQRG
jgi:septal ring factor EnvC (AmiA/AmiB activator)